MTNAGAISSGNERRTCRLRWRSGRYTNVCSTYRHQLARKVAQIHKETMTMGLWTIKGSICKCLPCCYGALPRSESCGRVASRSAAAHSATSKICRLAKPRAASRELSLCAARDARRNALRWACVVTEEQTDTLQHDKHLYRHLPYLNALLNQIPNSLNSSAFYDQSMALRSRDFRVSSLLLLSNLTQTCELKDAITHHTISRSHTCQ